MKTKFLYLLLILFIALKLSAQNENQVLLVKEAAASKAMYYLELIPAGSETGYGFANRSDFSKINIEEPYQTFYFSDRSNQLEFISGNEWRVPVSVDGEYRTLLTVRIREGKADVVGLGGSPLARKIQEFEALLPDKTNERIIIRNTYLERYSFTANFTALCKQNNGNGFIGINTTSPQPVYEVNNGQLSKTSIAALCKETINLITTGTDKK